MRLAKEELNKEKWRELYHTGREIQSQLWQKVEFFRNYALILERMLSPAEDPSDEESDEYYTPPSSPKQDFDGPKDIFIFGVKGPKHIFIFAQKNSFWSERFPERTILRVRRRK